MLFHVIEGPSGQRQELGTGLVAVGRRKRPQNAGIEYCSFGCSGNHLVFLGNLTVEAAELSVWCMGSPIRQNAVELLLKCLRVLLHKAVFTMIKKALVR